MPTTIRPRFQAATRGQADDYRIARGQIELIDAMIGSLSRLRDRLFGALSKPSR